MKTRKLFIVMALFAVITILALSMTGCEGDDDPEPTDNQSVPYGTLPGTTINIYKGDASLTDEQMANAVTKIQWAATMLNTETLITGFKGAIDAVHVKTGTQTIRNGKIVDVGCDAERSNISSQFVIIAVGG